MIKFVKLSLFVGTFVGTLNMGINPLPNEQRVCKSMKKEAATVAVVLNLKKAKQRKDGRSPLKLRVTYKREYKFYALIYLPQDAEKARSAGKEPIWEPGEVIAMTEIEYDRVFATHPRETYIAKNVFLTELRNAAIRVIESLGNGFSFETFESAYFSKPKDSNDLFSILEATAKQFREAGKISTAVTYECSLNSLKEYTGKEQFPFESVTVKFLKDYEKWMLSPKLIKGRKKATTNGRTTVSMYLRNVRTVFNKVKPAGVLYPFGKSKNGLYAVPKGKNTKKALTQADVAKIAAYEAAKGTMEEQCRDYWLFSYLCNGINIKDIARLKYENIKGDKIILVRAKTADTVEEETNIEIMITRQASQIIERHGNKPADGDSYIFPILYQGITPDDEYRLIQQTVRNINDNMTNICKDREIDRATTYTARHSFATVLKRSGASVEFISESLGHKSKQTTMNYLANFEDEEKKRWANMLLPETEV